MDKEKILKWCGFRRELFPSPGMGHWWVQRGNEKGVLLGEHPVLDMNFYFKYAVPKLSGASMSHANGLRFMWMLEYGADNRTEGLDKDPTEAFGKALEQLIYKEE